jgi:6-phosphogluconate dehydrogenase
MREASKEYGYGLHFDEIAKIWRGGCIIRAKILDRMRAAFAVQPDLVNLMTVSEFSPMVNELTPVCGRPPAWRSNWEFRRSGCAPR